MFLLSPFLKSLKTLRTSRGYCFLSHSNFSSAFQNVWAHHDGINCPYSSGLLLEYILKNWNEFDRQTLNINHMIYFFYFLSYSPLSWVGHLSFFMQSFLPCPFARMSSFCYFLEYCFPWCWRSNFHIKAVRVYSSSICKHTQSLIYVCF